MFDGPFDFARQVDHLVSPPMATASGDPLTLVCSYVNNTGSALGYNDSVTGGEHCYAATYAYGIGALGEGIYDCITN